ncbi:MAG: helix-turn-helix transcriptional regulator [Bacilli bacterium]|nr:helix-turn-helix transcriptional regulator [Bacilli bacterium]
MILSKIVGKKIKELRRENNKTQKQLGGFLGYSEAHISYIESGSRAISTRDLKKVADLFKVPLDSFLVSPGFSNNHFRSSKTNDGQEILDEDMWNDFINYAKKQ